VPIANWFLRSYGAFPLNRDGVDITAHRWSVAHLKSGGALALFPEGTRNPRGMGHAHPGVARLALSTKTRLLPVGITGTERLGSVLRVFNPTGRIRMNIGEPFELPPVEGRPGKDEMEALTGMIMRRIAALLPDEYRGMYSLEEPDEGSDTSP
jgi:1-acyl-sn-glycerol-3-phosphate acyltransferase